MSRTMDSILDVLGARSRRNPSVLEGTIPPPAPAGYERCSDRDRVACAFAEGTLLNWYPDGDGWKKTTKPELDEEENYANFRFAVPISDNGSVVQAKQDVELELATYTESPTYGEIVTHLQAGGSIEWKPHGGEWESISGRDFPSLNSKILANKAPGYRLVHYQPWPKEEELPSGVFRLGDELVAKGKDVPEGWLHRIVNEEDTWSNILSPRLHPDSLFYVEQPSPNPDPPEGWEVCKDTEKLLKFKHARQLRRLETQVAKGVKHWSEPGPWGTSIENAKKGLYAIPTPKDDDLVHVKMPRSVCKSIAKLQSELGDEQSVSIVPITLDKETIQSMIEAVEAPSVEEGE